MTEKRTSQPGIMETDRPRASPRAMRKRDAA